MAKDKKITVGLDLDQTGYKNGLKNAEKNTETFSNTAKKFIGSISSAFIGLFAVQQVANFIKTAGDK